MVFPGDPTTTGCFNMVARSRSTGISAYSGGTSQARTNSRRFWPSRTSFGTEGARRTERNRGKQMSSKVKRNCVVLIYIAVIVTIILALNVRGIF